MDNRIDKINYYLNIADTITSRGTCIRRNYGAVVVKNDEIVSTGYSGAPRGRKNCIDLGYCARQKLNIKSGEKYELCRSVHAEQNAIISAARKDLLGGTLYLVGREANGEYTPYTDSCSMCKRVVINAGIEKVIAKDIHAECGYRVINVADWVAYDEVLEEKVKPIIEGAEKENVN